MQLLANGVIYGLTIAVLALAFTTVYLPTRVFHVALAGVYAAVPYVAWACLQASWPWYLAVATAVLAGVIVSVACELVNHGPLEQKRAPSGTHLVSSLGLSILLVQAV